jgi:transcriptional regulator with PAS, ATPase and Fis domain
MHDLTNKAIRFARSSASVLITGESGTGKEMFSRLVHEHSTRVKQNYITVNCAAMPELLVESEFFGHERGSFTGAFQQRIGHFQTANRGTLLLDEISEIPASIQAKLLRVIEEQEIQRVGSSECEKIDVRVIATSNRNLKRETSTGAFRLDLYHRLSVLQLEIPPLRKRVDDIPVLAEYFLNLFRHEATQTITGISSGALAKLCNYHWPGNIRELRNVIHCACIDCRTNQLTPDCLPDLLEEPERLNLATMAGQTIADVERTMILASLKKNRGNKTQAAAELGVTPRTLSNKLKLYERDDYHEVA